MLCPYICFGWRTNSGRVQPKYLLPERPFLKQGFSERNWLMPIPANTPKNWLYVANVHRGFLNIFSLPDLLRSCSLHFFRHRSLLGQLLSKVKLLPVYRRSTATNSSSSIHPLFSCIEKAHILGNIFKNFELLSYIVTCTSPLGSTEDTNI